MNRLSELKANTNIYKVYNNHCVLGQNLLKYKTQSSKQSAWHQFVAINGVNEPSTVDDEGST